MQIEVQIMQEDYSLNKVMVDLPSEACVQDLLNHLQADAWIENSQLYAWSVFGNRVRSDTVLRQGDRFEMSLPLPSDPIDRRRKLALKRKNK